MIKLLTNCTYALSLIRSTKFKKYAITVKCLREKYIRLVQSLSVPHLLHFLWWYIISCAVTHNTHSQIPHHIKWSEVAQSCLTLCNPVNCIAHQAPLSMGFSRQEYWSGLPFPPPGDLPDPGIEPRSPALQADALTSEPPGKTHIIKTTELMWKTE